MRTRSPEQFAGAYAFADRIVAITYELVPDGFLIQGKLCLTVRMPATDDALGFAVLEALESFIPNGVLPKEKEMADRRQDQLLALGVSSERQLQKHALYCALHRNAAGIRFEPTHNGGHRGDQKGYHPIEGAFTIANSSVLADVGSALRAVFKQCTTAAD